MNKELKIKKSGNGQAISLKKKAMEEMGFKVGDTLNYTIVDDAVVLTKKPEKTYEEKMKAFIESGGTYDDKEAYDWGEPVGRERW